MSLESQIGDLVTATTDLTESVNARMDQVVQLATAENVSNKQFTNSTINSTPIGQGTPAAVKATTLTSTGATTLGAMSAASIDSTPVGQTTPAPIGATSLTMGAGSQVRRLLTLDIGFATYSLLEVPSGQTFLQVYGASEDAATPNVCVYGIAVNIGAQIKAVAQKAELVANEIKIVQHATTLKYYLAFKKGNANGVLFLVANVFQANKFADSLFQVSGVASLSGYNTLVTL
jgi:hypothetical protein